MLPRIVNENESKTKVRVTRQQILGMGLRVIDLDKVCEAMEKGRLVAPAIAKYIVGTNVYNGLELDQQSDIVSKVQEIIQENRLSLCIVN